MATTLVELVRRRAIEAPDAVAYRFLSHDGGETALRRCELERRARAVAAELQARGLAGERALLLVSPGLDYVTTFYGCLFAGVVAVPSYPLASGLHAPRIDAIATDARPAVLLAQSDTIVDLERHAARLPALRSLARLAIDAVAPGTEAGWTEPALDANSLALLQYTSGSTASPHGVMLSHANLLHNLAMIRQSFELSPDSRGVSWLPPYHDMGLIGGILEPLYAGFPVTLLSPLHFLKRPLAWLQAIARTGATCSGAPNFAYDLCAQRIVAPEREDLDLSRWRVAFCGAEPISAATLERFRELFAPAGFRPDAFRPCYGLAEATLLVSSARGGAVTRAFDRRALEGGEAVPAESDSRLLVASGRFLADQEVAVVEPRTRTRCPDGRVGEIWVAGPSVASGYWRREDETRETFDAKLPGSPSRHFLRTGDLGFFHRKELFVTGRVKDLIVVHGRNHHPHDLERTVEKSHPALRPMGGAAFSIALGGAEPEEVVVVQELRRDGNGTSHDAVFRAIREAVAAEHDLRVRTVVLIRQGSLAKTSSGKVRRQACKSAYLARTLEVVAASTLEIGGWEPGGELTRVALLALPSESRRAALAAHLGERVARLTGAAEPVDGSSPLCALGLDSLAAAGMGSGIEADFGVALPLPELLQAGLDRLTTDILARVERGDKEPLLPVAADPEGVHPLSSLQQALWYLYTLAPQSANSNLGCALRMAGDLRVDALRQACQGLANRHSVLRTTFHALAGVPEQRVHPWMEVEFAITDAARWPAAEFDAALELEVLRPFDLERGSLLRFALFRLSPHEHLLLLAAHHIICDLGSLALLVAELRASYSDPGAVPLAPSRPFVEYARWQRERLAGPEGERHWRYWSAQLAGLPLGVRLPTPSPRPRARELHGADFRFALPPALTAAAARLAAARGLTLYTVLLATFLVLLRRLTGEEDLVVGSPMAGRGSAAWARTVGPLVNMVSLRADLSDAPRFADLLAQTWSTVLAALEHQEYPFAMLVERLRPERVADAHPIFNLAFSLQRAEAPGGEVVGALAIGHPAAHLEMGELSLAPHPLAKHTSQFDLTLSFAEFGGVLAGNLEYDTALLDAESIRRLAEHYTHLLVAVATVPEQKISDLPLPEAEMERVLYAWNCTEIAHSGTIEIQEMVAARAATTPSAVAVSSDRGALTYAELDRRANQLAHHLRALGVRVETLVAVAVERCAEMAVVLLGILKAGGAYVPLDPDYPAERTELILAETAAPLLITNLPPGPGPSRAPTVVHLDADRELIAARPTAAPSLAAAPDNLAYVLYTSGSTGSPKGVMVTRRALGNLLFAMAREIGITAEAVWVSVSTLTFDIAASEIFLPLLAGGRVVVAGRDAAADGRLLIRLLAEANVMQATPVTWRLLLDAGWRGGGHFTALSTGEALPPELAARLAATDVELWNLYGPTETTVYSCVARLDCTEVIPIGHPIANTRVYLLDPWPQPTPVGAPGELAIGGVGLARGYLGRPELTADRFVPDPFGPPGERLYRTGDRLRRYASGDLEFLGRIDRQLKIRGLRIEPGEVEAILGRHPAVREAVVAPYEPVPGDWRLAAYVVPEPAAAASPARLATELLWALRARLPRSMVPAAITFLAGLPRLPNGKLDRSALPEPTTVDPERPYVAPRGPTEEAVAAAWAERLGVARVGADDDFFALGGHSLLAVEIAAKLRDALGVDVPQRVFWETTRLSDLAARIDEAAGPAGGSLLLMIRRHSVPGPRPLSLPQQRLWFLEQLEPGTPAYNSFFCARLRGEIDPDLLDTSLGDLADRHQILRTTFGVRNGRPCQLAGHGARPQVEVADLRRGGPDGDLAAALERLDDTIHRPFDLASGPLARLLLCRLPGEEILGLVAHHLIADGWSLDIALRELAALYEARASGGRLALAPLPFQYGDFAAWQRDPARVASWESDLGYWRELLTDLPPLELPTDRPRPPVLSSRGDWQEFRLPRVLSDALREVARAACATPFMVLTAAASALLAKLSGQRTVALGTAVANRVQPETFGLIGPFVNLVVLRTRIVDDPSWSELLEQVRETCVGAFTHQQVPFERVVEELRVDRDLSRTVLFQVLFVLQPPRGQQQLAGVSLEPIELGLRTARTDLEIHLWDQAEFAGRVAFSTDLFDVASIERLLDRFRTLLAAFAADPARRLSSATLTSPEERQLLAAWGRGPAREIPPIPVHELVARQAAQRPDAIAVVCGERRLSYRALDGRADELAHRLRALGVGPEVPVAVFVERSIEMIIAVLGVLKAGGAYVPLDPGYPAERLALIMGDARASVVVTERALASEPTLRESATICLDLDEDGDGDPSSPRLGRAPGRPAGGETLAYVLYTSGSTGTPKGVQISHRALANLVASMIEQLGLGPGEVQATVASLSFDASVAEIFPPLSAGATLAVVPAANLSDGGALSRSLLEAGVTVLQGTATLWRMLVESGGLDGRRLQALFGGEATPPALAEAITTDHWPAWHMYGPTETTVWSSACRASTGAHLALGRPLANTGIHLLDLDFAEVPVGVAGEICIGGAGVSRGYLSNPALTAERFVPSPISGERGARLYRTGDRGRYLADGALRFLGRQDYQLKIRGFRVEPGEIEAALLHHPGLRAAIVSADEAAGAPRRLIAHVVPAGESMPPVEELRSFLRRSLPDYMVPSLFLPIAELPRTPSGKVDRRALPLSGSARPLLIEEFVPPHTAEERRLAGVWCEVLGLDGVGVYDNFFAVGGDSIRALQVVSLARTTGLEVSVQALFQYPTIRGILESPGLAPEAFARSEPPPFALLSDADRAVLERRGVAVAQPSAAGRAGEA